LSGVQEKWWIDFLPTVVHKYNTVKPPITRLIV
jgi:hypothetical protein